MKLIFRNLSLHVIFVTLLFGISGCNSANKMTSNNEEEPVFKVGEDFFEQVPTFDSDINLYLSKNLSCLTEFMKNNTGGKVKAQFIIEKDGSITNVEIIESTHPTLAIEVKRAIKRMPKWKPGYRNGNPVKSLYVFPFRFRSK